MERLLIRKACGSTYFKLVDDQTHRCLSSLEVAFQTFSLDRKRKLEFPDCDIFYLSDFTTKFRERKKGYGRQLLNLVKENTKGKFIYLIVHTSDGFMKDNQLVEFYKSIGFEVHEKKDMYQWYTWMVLDNR